MTAEPGGADGRAFTMRAVDGSDSLPAQFASSVLAGRGATVLRPARGEPANDPATRFVSRGVTSVSAASGRAAWDRLLDDADVLLVSAPTGPWGSIAELAHERPRLVIVAATPRGLEDYDPRRPATALTLAAESGFLGITGEPDGVPEAIRGHVMEFACGWAIATAAIAALRQRNITGRGTVVDLSFLEVLVFLQWNATQRAAFENVVMQRQGARGMGHPWGVYPCKDGHVILIVGAGGRNWAKFAELMERPELAGEQYQSPVARARNADEIDALMLPWLLEHTAEEIFTAAQSANLPFGMVRTSAGLLGDAQLQARRFFQPDDAGLLWPQLPFRIDGVRLPWEATPAATGAER